MIWENNWCTGGANADGIVTRQGEAKEEEDVINGSAFASEEYADEDEDEEAVLPENHAQQVDAWRQLFDPAERSTKRWRNCEKRETRHTKCDP